MNDIFEFQLLRHRSGIGMDYPGGGGHAGATPEKAAQNILDTALRFGVSRIRVTEKPSDNYFVTGELPALSDDVTQTRQALETLLAGRKDVVLVD